jgi:hypothetical protein
MTQTTKNQPFFTRDGDSYIPTQIANGPWDPKSLHGRVIIGLLGYVIEQRHGGDDFVPARLTVDMFRLPNILTPIEVRTKLIRDGLRIRVVEAEFVSGGVAMARASCQLLRRTENPQGQVWSPPNWDAPLPASLRPVRGSANRANLPQPKTCRESCRSRLSTIIPVEQR